MKKTSRKKARGRKASAMVPYTKNLADQAMTRVLAIMAEHGLVELGGDAEATADQAMRALREHGVMEMTDEGEELVVIGRCIWLPRQGRGFSMLIVTPCPADQYGPDLQPKRSPVRFERTQRGNIIVPGRWLAARLEELAKNPTVPDELRTLAGNMSRRAEIPDIVLPAEVGTIALPVRNKDGTETIIEALLPGQEISVGI